MTGLGREKLQSTNSSYQSLEVAVITILFVKILKKEIMALQWKPELLTNTMVNDHYYWLGAPKLSVTQVEMCLAFTNQG